MRVYWRDVYKCILKDCSLREEKTQSLKLNPSGIFVMGESQILQAIIQKSLSLDFKTSNEETQRGCWAQ